VSACRWCNAALTMPDLDTLSVWADGPCEECGVYTGATFCFSVYEAELATWLNPDGSIFYDYTLVSGKAVRYALHPTGETLRVIHFDSNPEGRRDP